MIDDDIELHPNRALFRRMIVERLCGFSRKTIARHVRCTKGLVSTILNVYGREMPNEDGIERYVLNEALTREEIYYRGRRGDPQLVSDCLGLPKITKLRGCVYPQPQLVAYYERRGLIEPLPL